MSLEKQEQMMIDEEEISIRDIIQFFILNGKKIALFVVLGAFIGLIGSVLLGQYKVETILVNSKLSMLDSEQNTTQNIDKPKVNNHALDFLTWRTLVKQLPTLASRQIAQNTLVAEQIPLFKSMSEPKWWDKNVTVAYSLSKSDMKDFAVISKDLQENDAQTILGLVVSQASRDQAEALKRSQEITDFLRSGSIYLELTSLLDKYDAEVLTSGTDIQNKRIDLQVKQAELLKRIKNLEALRVRYPQKSLGQESQVLNVDDEKAKYMPLTTQLIAAHVELNHTQEKINQLDNLTQQLVILGRFVGEGRHDLQMESNGHQLASKLNTRVSELLKTYGQDNINALEILSRVRNDVTLIDARFMKGLIVNQPTINKTSKLIPTLLGALLGGFLMTVYLLILAAWRREGSNA
ncbi:MAG: hypothetical protein KGI13_04950 [Betaproteobacteria bacterium]|nr:hypothetical protein [Betaproteobacteria bacterium]